MVRIVNSCRRSAVPEDAAWQADNAVLSRGSIEGGPRYGGSWSRASANANDIGYGLGYAEYQGTAEFLAVVQRNGEAFARMASVDPASGTWTEITTGSANAQNLPADGFWQFEQFGEYVYINHVGTSTQMYRRKVGDLSTTAAFEVWTPVYNRGAGFGARVEAPPYLDFTFAAATLVNPGALAVALSNVGSATFRLDFTGIVGTGTVYVVLQAQTDWDIRFSDVIGTDFTASAAMSTPVNCAIAFSEDSSSAIDSAWCARQYFFENDPHINTSGSSWKNTIIFSSYVASRTSRRPIRRIVLRFQDSTGAFTTGNATYDLVALTLGGIRLWDITLPSSGTVIGYAVRWANRKGSTFKYTPLVRLPDQIVYDGGTGLDMVGTRPAGATRPFLGSRIRLSVPYDPRRASEGYDFVEFFRQDSAASTDWYKVAEVAHEGGAGTLLTVTDSTLQSVVDAGASAATPSQAGPSTNCDCIGGWKDHLLLGVDRKVFMSTAGVPGEFVPPADEIAGAYDPSDLTLGRTFYPARGRREGAVAFASGDALAIGTSRQTIGVLGDSAQESSVPRPYPGSLGVLGPRAMAAFEDGAVVAHATGLYYYPSFRAAPGLSESQIVGIELTEPVRESWTRLLQGTDGSGMVVAYADGDVWCWLTNGGTTRFLRLALPGYFAEGREWQEGTFTNGVVAAVSVGGKGTRIQLSNGKVARLRADAAGTDYTSDDGSAVAWTVTSGDLAGIRERVVGIFAQAIGAGVTLTFSVDDGKGSGGMTALAAITLEEGRHWVSGVNLHPGSVRRLVVSGTVGTNRLDELVLVVDGEGLGYGS